MTTANILSARSNSFSGRRGFAHQPARLASSKPAALPSQAFKPSLKPPLFETSDTYLPSPISEEESESGKASVGTNSNIAATDDVEMTDWASPEPQRRNTDPIPLPKPAALFDVPKRNREDDHGQPQKMRRYDTVSGALFPVPSEVDIPIADPVLGAILPDTGRMVDNFKRVSPETVCCEEYSTLMERLAHVA